jgi:hypothetical protein
MSASPSQPLKVSAQYRLRLAPDAAPVELERDGPPCPVCFNLAYRNKPEKERRNWGQWQEFELIGAIDMRYLHQNSSSDCGYCSILWKVMKHFDIHPCVGIDSIELSVLKGSHLVLAINKDFQVEISAYSTFCQPPEDLWARFGRSTCPNFATESNSYITFVKGELEACRTRHSNCRRPLPALPTRLLFVGNGVDSMKLSIPEKESRGCYAALSHCWGKSKIIQLTKVTEESLKLSVSWDSLPRTFQDAVTVCQHLGIDYLWIDSLCIIQDDEEDWDREAVMMANVYNNAEITIAASASSGPDKSFLAIRKQGRCEPITIAWTDDTEPSPLLKARRIPLLGHHQGLEFDGLREPLQRRAWAFQESLLSHRLVSFTSEEIQWACPHYRTCECGNLRNFVGSIHGSKNSMGIDDWTSVMQKYSPLSLTFGKDKLTALSGVATRFQKHPSTGYLAGLWMDGTIVSQLSWTVAQTQKPPESNLPDDENPVYRAPTFSWASVDGLVYCWGPSEHEYVGILRAAISLKGQSSFGEVRDGYVRVTGRILQTELLLSDGSGHYMHSPELGDLRGQCFKVLLDAEFPDQIYLTWRERPNTNVEAARPGRSYYWSRSPSHNSPASVPVWLLRLLKYDYDVIEEKWLILVRSCRVEGAFERVALWYINVPDSERDREHYAKLVALWHTIPEQEITLI